MKKVITILITLQLLLLSGCHSAREIREAYDEGYAAGYEDGVASVRSASRSLPNDSESNFYYGEPTTDEGYIGNKNSHKFHLPTCSSLPAEKNQVLFDTREEAVEAGYTPCGNCNP